MRPRPGHPIDDTFRPPQAEKLATDLDREFPVDTLLQNVLLPSIRAVNVLNRHHIAKAIELLQPALPYEFGAEFSTEPIYIRGEAYLAAGNGASAATEFQKIIDRPGFVTNHATGALARLGVARAYRLEGDSAKARAAYQDFLALWKDADPRWNTPNCNKDDDAPRLIPPRTRS